MARKRNTENDLISTGGASPTRRKATGAASRARRAKPAEAEAALLRDAVTIPPAAETVPSVEETPVAAVSAPASEPSHEEIAALAYSYWAARGYQGGSPEEDWVRAEQELRARYNGASAAVA